MSVAAIAVHGACAHGVVPSTNASSAETNVTEVAANPQAPAPPAVAAVPAVAGELGVAAAVTGGLVAAGAAAGAHRLEAEGAADGPAVLELPVPHAVSVTA